jgi:hypothetical protein
VLIAGLVVVGVGPKTLGGALTGVSVVIPVLTSGDPAWASVAKTSETAKNRHVTLHPNRPLTRHDTGIRKRYRDERP